ncbi:GDP-Man:Man(3)GlcNAc(2)-PP-Dol alpha-1,2-mannosyltransferase-like [Homarus americanus]|uniref:GDP-Man:Man(3)GlcNAc(2)-PP-Dol alpha-1,2-mannosyltransferase n=1 Tax=Homarus americanus TaxID=6706 RepID=A0A8J5JW26_HOMAM|nr:GDP-Man:Man(3)GlcNAc(2)-PP-Dol alpha-1,2-mannosyltransferase-like [Homarus americanus]KAG7164956.1 GDP-Man:Man(3)GlcNAc(2)-PP-Dol alpha-1-2-mannosyltransferase-like [Homarus americanus]
MNGTTTNLIDSLMELFNLTSEMLSLSIRVWSLGIMILLQLLVLLAGLACICWFLLKFCVYTLRRGEPGYLHVAFFHPYCNAGGGGERVLWCAIRSLQKKYQNVKCYVYTGDTDVTPQQILQKAQQRFNVVLPRPIEFIFLNSRTLVEAKHYPFLTLMMQSVGSVFLAGEALSKFRPDIYMDSMGYAFTYPVFRFIGGCTVGCYTHYPTISTDMLGQVANRVESHNNREFIARNIVFSMLKLGYYHLFALMYALVGRCAKLVMVNSSWTHGHITALWGQTHNTHIVYPPCDTEHFKNLPRIRDLEKKFKTIISIGQFRPEKDHTLQLKAFQRLCEILDPTTVEVVQLVLIGGCRNEEDHQRVENLKNLASTLGIEDKIVWKLNASFAELLECVQNGTVGLHTMWCEHFGICVVESMAGGLLMVAHDSGGPKMDIVIEYEGEQTGYLATDAESYAQAMKTIFELTDEGRDNIRIAARNSVDRFSDDQFEISFLSVSENIFSSAITNE